MPGNLAACHSSTQLHTRSVTLHWCGFGRLCPTDSRGDEKFDSSMASFAAEILLLAFQFSILFLEQSAMFPKNSNVADRIFY
jgi:hypothetical protein